MSYVGQAMKAVEDPKLVMGRGAFVNDITRPEMLHAAVLRSPYAHARIKAVDVSAARSLPGVEAVLTGADIAGILADIPTRAMTGERAMDELHPPEHPVLAKGKVCYVGQAVAVVVAPDPYMAGDALERIVVDYEPLTPSSIPMRPPGLIALSFTSRSARMWSCACASALEM